VLDKLPKRLQPEAKEKLHDIWMAVTRADAVKVFDLFLGDVLGQPRQPSACRKDRDVLLAFYNLPGGTLGPPGARRTRFESTSRTGPAAHRADQAARVWRA
jgi:hypothetical protein